MLRALFAGAEPVDPEPLATALQTPHAEGLQASASSYLLPTLSRDRFGGPRVKAPAEHRTPVQTPAERNLLIELWAEHGKKPGRDCMKLVLRDFNKRAIAQLEEYKRTGAALPMDEILELKDIGQLNKFIKDLTRSEEQRHAQLFSRASTYLSACPVNTEHLATPLTSPTMGMPLQPNPLPAAQPALSSFPGTLFQPLPVGSSLAPSAQQSGPVLLAGNMPSGSHHQPQGDLSAFHQQSSEHQPASKKRRRQQHAAAAREKTMAKQQLQHLAPHEAQLHFQASVATASFQGSPAPAPSEAKRSNRGGRGTTHECRECHMPKAGHGQGKCIFVERDDAGNPIVDKTKPNKPDRAIKEGIPYHLLNELGLARMAALQDASNA